MPAPGSSNSPAAGHSQVPQPPSEKGKEATQRRVGKKHEKLLCEHLEQRRRRYPTCPHAQWIFTSRLLTGPWWSRSILKGLKFPRKDPTGVGEEHAEKGAAKKICYGLITASISLHHSGCRWEIGDGGVPYI